MGLSVSTPFEGDEKAAKVEIERESKEIGICQLVDPRSPSCDFERTPIYYRTQRATDREEVQVVIQDPRSPSNGITRTPLASETAKAPSTTTDEEIENQLRAQIERLKLFDSFTTGPTNSSDNLANDKDIINPKKTILKLLEEASASPTATENVDSICLPNTPPCPKSRSTPKDAISPVTPLARQIETGKLLKKKYSNGNRQPKRPQQSKPKKLQKAVLKKSLGEQVTRSPLAERNYYEIKSGKSYNKKTSKQPGFTKYRKYSNLDESLTEVFPGKENEEAVW